MINGQPGHSVVGPGWLQFGISNCPVRHPNCDVGSLCRHSTFVGAPSAAGTFEVGHRQAARPFASTGLSEFPMDLRPKSASSSSLTARQGEIATMAARNKCLARNNKSGPVQSDTRLGTADEPIHALARRTGQQGSDRDACAILRGTIMAEQPVNLSTAIYLGVFSRAEQRVLQAIFKAIAEGGGKCVATLAMLAHDSNTSKSTTRNAITRAVEIGLLEKMERRSVTLNISHGDLGYGGGEPSSKLDTPPRARPRGRDRRRAAPAIARRAPRPGFDLGQRADRSAQSSRFRGRAGPGFFSDLALSFQ